MAGGLVKRMFGVEGLMLNGLSLRDLGLEGLSFGGLGLNGLTFGGFEIREVEFGALGWWGWVWCFRVGGVEFVGVEASEFGGVEFGVC